MLPYLLLNMAKKNKKEERACPLCGTMLEQGEAFCSNCGEEVQRNGKGGNGDGDDDEDKEEPQEPPFKGW